MRKPVEEINTSVIPVKSSDLYRYLMLINPSNSATAIPVNDEIVLSCPITPRDLSNVFAISISSRLETMFGI